jgi:pyridinium-3,5-bisthiocarboxylic acid mononucleotide nickel chelatase
MGKIAYFDCADGISGDMTLAALVDAGAPLDALQAAIQSLGLPGLKLQAAEVKRHGFRATQIVVEAPPEHVHRHLHDILALIDAGRLTGKQKDTARRIFTRLAEVEAHVHGISVEEVHFHEVGAADSIADIVGTAVGLDLLGVERVAASAVATGTGRIKIAHGQCSVPAPATAELLRGVPLAASSIEAELTTPTGAAILATLAESFGPPPPMTIDRIGCGAGHKDFPQQANILRLWVGTAAGAEKHADAETDQIVALETNLDDLSGEVIGYCIGRLWDAGALDVYTTPIAMKKNRPAVTLTVLCRPADATAMEDILFMETTTLGIRRWTAARRILPRQPHCVETPFGPIEGKTARLPGGALRFAPEYESCRLAAETHKVPLRDVFESARRAFGEGVRGQGSGVREK